MQRSGSDQRVAKAIASLQVGNVIGKLRNILNTITIEVEWRSARLAPGLGTAALLRKLGYFTFALALPFNIYVIVRI